MRQLTYAEAIREATEQMMEKDSSVFVIGQGVWSPWYVGHTCDGLLQKFGEKRVIDTPVSEAAVTGAASGAAMAGMKPILIHPRMDFMYMAFDQIINQAANWHYMFGGKVNVPLVIRGIINRGGEQAAQHSQAIQALFSHIPGLKVVMPSTPYDAKGLLVSAVQDGNPVIYIEDRWLYEETGEVPEEIYEVPIGKGIIRKEGKDVTIACFSYLAREAVKAAEVLEKEGISAEIVDLRSIKPLDRELLFESIKKTGRLVITDTGWGTGGVSAEIASQVSRNLFNKLKSRAIAKGEEEGFPSSPSRAIAKGEEEGFPSSPSPIEIVAIPDIPAPASRVLEKLYYPMSQNIIKAVKKICDTK